MNNWIYSFKKLSLFYRYIHLLPYSFFIKCAVVFYDTRKTYFTQQLKQKIQFTIIVVDILCLTFIIYKGITQSPKTIPFQIIPSKGVTHDVIQTKVFAASHDKILVDQLLSKVPNEAKDAARKNLPYIIQALREENILNPNVLAYAIATIEHETAGTFEPIEEYDGRYHALVYGYEGGIKYYGRGFIQLTHLHNYRDMGNRIGIGNQLVEKPDLALKPVISAKILAVFFKDNGIADMVTNGDFIDARIPINPDWNGRLIATLANKYL